MMYSISEIVKEVLNENIDKVRRIAAKIRHAEQSSTIHGNSPLNQLSECGESVLHISVYKWNRRMVKIFLEAGADPNFPDHYSETSVHIAAKLGQYDILSDLYFSGRCDLNIQTSDGFTALDLCVMDFNPDDDLVTMRNFKNWDSRLSDDTEQVRQGRQLCANFLKEKMDIDHQVMLDKIGSDCTLWMTEQNSLRKVLAQPDVDVHYFSSQVGVEYPEQTGNQLISPEKQKLFEKYRIGVHYVGEDCFSNEFVNQSISVGAAKAAAVIVGKKI